MNLLTFISLWILLLCLISQIYSLGIGKVFIGFMPNSSLIQSTSTSQKSNISSPSFNLPVYVTVSDVNRSQPLAVNAQQLIPVKTKFLLVQRKFHIGSWIPVLIQSSKFEGSKCYQETNLLTITQLTGTPNQNISKYLLRLVRHMATTEHSLRPKFATMILLTLRRWQDRFNGQKVEWRRRELGWTISPTVPLTW